MKVIEKVTVYRYPCDGKIFGFTSDYELVVDVFNGIPPVKMKSVMDTECFCEKNCKAEKIEIVVYKK